MTRTKGMMGFTLYPDKAYMEIKVKLYNRTPQPQTFLWWANPAVKVNDHYQSVFPPDVHAVFDHGKKDVSDFPIATGTYYKVDYAPGTDISKYKNIPVPTSYMAINSAYNFVGGFENDSQGGLLHVADNNISPGKKQWTWGHGDFGKSWDLNLTDEDGPYIELMCGVYTDNQSDFSWIHPFEEKTFSQYFMPYRDLGVVKNATKEAMLNLEFKDETAIIKCYTLGIYSNAKIVLKAKNETLFETIIKATPRDSYENRITINPDLEVTDYNLTLFDASGNVLATYQPLKKEEKEIPEAAKAAKEPKEIKSIEQLYLRGHHLEQYRHATFKPEDYYLEALSREPGDARCNNAMGVLMMKNGQFKQAETYFNKAIETLTEKNPNPYDGEAYYNLGQALKYQYKFDEAYKALYKSAWNAAWQDAAYFHLAQIATIKSNYVLAIELVEKALIRNWHNHKARTLKIALLRKTKQTKKANNLIAESLSKDRFNFSAMFENYLLTNNNSVKEKLKILMSNSIDSYIEYALDYANSGLYNEAISLLKIGINNCKPHSLAYYYLGWLETLNNDIEKAVNTFKKAKTVTTDYSFAYRLEAVLALESAIDNSEDPVAYYHLGNLWYDKKQYQLAINCWEKSKNLNPNFPTVL